MIELMGAVLVGVILLYGIPAWILCSYEEKRTQKADEQMRKRR